jgi:hypothetical protein
VREVVCFLLFGFSRLELLPNFPAVSRHFAVLRAILRAAAARKSFVTYIGQKGNSPPHRTHHRCEALNRARGGYRRIYKCRCSEVTFLSLEALRRIRNAAGALCQTIDEPRVHSGAFDPIPTFSLDWRWDVLRRSGLFQP